LERAIREMIQDDMHVLYHIQNEDLGQRLMTLPNEVKPYPGVDVNADICGRVATDTFATY